MTRLNRGKEILGDYFSCCEGCTRNGNCQLRHYEFMGVTSGDGVDKTPYGGHQDVAWALIAFQDGTPRAHCTGRIKRIDSMYFDLACKCGTVIDSDNCRRFEPNGDYWEREEAARALAWAMEISTETAALILFDPWAWCYPGVQEALDTIPLLDCIVEAEITNLPKNKTSWPTPSGAFITLVR